MSNDHWSIKVYDDEGNERETIRGLTVARKHILMQIFEREGVHATASKYTDEGKYAGESETVNGR